MATKSFLKEINIKDPKVARNFAKALEKIESKETPTQSYSKNVKKLSRSQIRKVFGDL